MVQDNIYNISHHSEEIASCIWIPDYGNIKPSQKFKWIYLSRQGKWNEQNMAK